VLRSKAAVALYVQGLQLLLQCLSPSRLLLNIRQHLQRQQCVMCSEVLQSEAAVQSYDYCRQAAAQHTAAPAVTAVQHIIMCSELLRSEAI
jgi:hypothetical protein